MWSEIVTVKAEKMKGILMRRKNPLARDNKRRVRRKKVTEEELL
jgi:hypothetical protein